MVQDTPTVDQSRIQGFGSEAAAGATGTQPSGVPAGQRSPWDDILTTDILTAIAAASEDLSCVVTQMATNVRGELERVKSAFNCQAPDTATLSAEQIVVDHAVGQVKSVFSCGAPDKADDADSEVIITTAPLKEEPDVVPQEGGASSSTESANVDLSSAEAEKSECAIEPPEVVVQAAAVDLLDLSEPTPPPPPLAPSGGLLISAPDGPGKSWVVSAPEVLVEEQKPQVLVDLLDMSEPSPEFQDFQGAPAEHTDQVAVNEQRPQVPSDLFDFSTPVAPPPLELQLVAAVEQHPQVQPPPPDLFDFSAPAQAAVPELSQVQSDLFDFSMPALAPAPAPATVQMAIPAPMQFPDLLDFSSTPRMAHQPEETPCLIPVQA